MTSSKLIKHEPPRIASYLNQFANKTAYLKPKFCDALPMPTLFCFYQNGSPIYCIAYLKPKKKSSTDSSTNRAGKKFPNSSPFIIIFRSFSFPLMQISIVPQQVSLFLERNENPSDEFSGFRLF